MGVEQDKTIDELLQAREAFDRRDWVVAFERLRNAGDLGAEDTMALATSAYLVILLQLGEWGRRRALRLVARSGAERPRRGGCGRRLGRPGAATSRDRD